MSQKPKESPKTESPSQDLSENNEVKQELVKIPTQVALALLKESPTPSLTFSIIKERLEDVNAVNEALKEQGIVLNNLDINI